MSRHQSFLVEKCEQLSQTRKSNQNFSELSLLESELLPGSKSLGIDTLLSTAG